MSLLRHVTLAAAFCLAAPAALAQMTPPARIPENDPRGATFGCEDGSKLVLAFAETGTLPWLVRKRAPHEIAITDEAGKRLSTVRITNFLKERAAQ